MSRRAAHPLRALTPAEVQDLQHVVKANSERADVIKRAQALMEVNADQGYTEAAGASPQASG